jgi:MFS transporter, OFA family, oxalate/formate antiporter
MSKSDGVAKSNFGKKGWGILILAFFSILLMSLIVYDSLNVTIPAFAAQKGWNVAILYVFSTIAAWISVIGAALWGGICSKKTNGFGWVAALLLGAVGCVIWAFAGSPVVYLICLALAMVGGMGFAYIANLNVISNWFPTKKGLVMGWVTIGFPLSATIAVPFVSGLLGAVGLQGVYFVFAGFCVVLALLVGIIVRDYPEQSGAFPDNNKNFDKEQAQKELDAGLEYMKTSQWTGKTVFKAKETKKIVFSLGVMELLALGIMTNYVPRMMQIGFAEEQIIPLLVIAGVVAMFGSYLCGVLDAHVGPKKAIWIT